MTTSLYAPPQADLAMTKEAEGENAFYVVSARKFTILFLITVGLYQLYWFYQHWSIYKARAQYDDAMDRDIWPVARAIFAIFFVHSLCREVTAYAASKGREISSGLFAPTLLTLLLIVSSVFDRMSWKEIWSPYSDVLSLVMLLPLWIVSMRAQQYINACCGDEKGSSNNDLTGANLAWIIVGTLFWILVLIGTIDMFIPLFEEAE
jgi:hypothetical protein